MTQLTENLTVWELWYFKAVNQLSWRTFSSSYSPYNCYSKVVLARHLKFPLAFGERLFPTLRREYSSTHMTGVTSGAGTATLPEHLSSPPVLSGVRVTRSLVLYVCFVDHCLSFCTSSFGHCFVCFSLIYRFWLPRWYLQTLLKRETNVTHMYKVSVTGDRCIKCQWLGTDV
jgi:hypothetical protein